MSQWYGRPKEFRAEAASSAAPWCYGICVMLTHVGSTSDSEAKNHLVPGI